MTIHLLCTFHLWSNFEKRIKRFFRASDDKPKWNNLVNIWWKLVQTSDITFQRRFQTEYDKFSDIIQPTRDSLGAGTTT